MAKRRDSNTDQDSVSFDDPTDSHDPSLGSAPTPKEAEAAKERAVTKKAEKVEPLPAPKPVVPYRVFAALSGMKPDRLAGFQHYVTREEMKPTTVTGWNDRYDAFMSKPVKSLKR